MNSGEAYISLADYASGIAGQGRISGSLSHSFTPLLSDFAGDRWRKGSEGIFTQVWANGGSLQGGTGFKIRVAAHPAIADKVLRAVVPIIVEAGCPFKVIANTALLELVGAKLPSEDPAGDFITVYPPSQALFNDLTEHLRHAVQALTESYVPMPAPEPRGRAALSADNPWPGLGCYLPDDAAYFFGREADQTELAQRIERAIVTVVLGQPGVGKSSLVRAGLKRPFERLSFEPVYLRLRSDGDVQPVQQVRDEINRVLAEGRIDGAPFGEGQTLRDYFHLQEPGWVDAQKKVVVPVLIFDQLEELLTFEGADFAAVQPVEAFWTQLAGLVSNRGREPMRQLQLPSVDPSSRSSGFKVVLSLRQDCLPKLLARRAQLPQIAQNQFLLKPINGRKAVEAVHGSGKSVLDPADAETLAEQIVRRVGRETTQASDKAIAAGGAAEPLDNLKVDLALLNFFCQQLNEARKESRRGLPGTCLITAELIQSEAGRIFEDFLQPGEISRNGPTGVHVAEPRGRVQALEPQPTVRATKPPVADDPIEPEPAVTPPEPEATLDVPETPAIAREEEPALAVQPLESPVAFHVTEEPVTDEPIEPEPAVTPPEPEATLDVPETPAIAREEEPALAVQPLESPAALHATEAPVTDELIEPEPAVTPPEPDVTLEVLETPAIAREEEPALAVQPLESPAALHATEAPVTDELIEPEPAVPPPESRPIMEVAESPAIVHEAERPAAIQSAGLPSAIELLEPNVTVPVAEPKTSIQEPPKVAEKEKLPASLPGAPGKAQIPPYTGRRPRRRLRNVAVLLSMAAIVIFAVLAVTYFEELQRAQTEVELQQYISNLAATKNTLQSAHQKLSVAESDLAIKESNLLVLIQQVRAQEQENRAEQEQNSKLAGEQTNSQSRIRQLNSEKAQAEARLAQWSGLMNDLTNQLAILARQKEELETSNHALIITNRVLGATNPAPAPASASAPTSAPPASTPPSISSVASFNLRRPGASSAAGDKQAAAMENLPDTLPATPETDAEASARRNVDILYIHGECLYSDVGVGFHPLETHRVLHQGAIIQTSKNSWCDLFIRRAGTVVRLAPETQMKIARLDLATENGFPVVDTLLVLPHGRLFTVVRALVPGSTLEISDGVGRSVVEVGGIGSYMITAPRPDVGGDQLTLTPLRIVTQQGSSLIAPGQQYTAKDSAAFSLTPSYWEMNLIRLDDLEFEADKALAERISPKP